MTVTSKESYDQTGKKTDDFPLKLIYDMSVIGLSLQDDRSKTGVYRVVTEILNELQKMDLLQIDYSHTDFSFTIEKTEEHLQKKIHNRIKYRLRRNIMGRGARYFRQFYNLFNIDVDEMIYDERVFEDADIFHSPFHKIPNILKKYSNLERVITIYDLIPIKFPHLHNMKNALEEIVISVGDDYAICISDCTRNDLLEYDRSIDPEKVFVSHLAADPQKFYPCKNEAKKFEVQKKYNLPDNYFLSLCMLEPRKNLARLIRCFIRFIKQQNIHDLKLVLVGTKGWNFESIFDEVHGANEYRDRIVVTGRIPDAELASVYSQAHSFYYLSLYEGFGLPPLEAMQCGVATVTSNVSSLPEVVGDGGIMVNPEDEDEICEVMYKLYKNESLQTEYIAKALQQAKKFSWEKTAQQHLDIYQKMLGNR